jgi:hypothetical protein
MERQGAGPASATGDSSSLGRVGARAATVLRHPLVLLAVGATVSGILVPHFTSQYQHRSQDLELKTTLIKEINEATRPLYESLLQADTTFSTPSAVAAVKQAFIVWVGEKDAVHDDLNAYFPRSRDLQRAWNRYAAILGWAGRIVANTVGDAVRQNVLESQFPRWSGLERCVTNCDNTFWLQSMIRVELDVRAAKQRVIAELLKAHSAL